MKTKDLLTIGSVALGTATLTVLTFWSDCLEAGDEQEALQATISRPKLVMSGVEMSLVTADGRVFKAGDEPAFQLQAVNTTDAPANVDVWVALRASSPADALSRVVRLPSILWQQHQPLALKPHETKVIALPASTKLPPKSVISVSLQGSDPLQRTGLAVQPLGQSPNQPAVSAQPGIIALTFSTATPELQPAPAS